MSGPDDKAASRPSPRPRIGITSGTAAGWEESGYLWRHLARAVEEAGGEAVWLGAATFADSDAPAFSEALNRLDGLLLPGGADIDPREGAYDGLDPDDSAAIDALNIVTEPARDAYELPLARTALDLDMPVFGICRGYQVLNVACGGRLLPDLRTGLRHRAYSEPLSSAHLIETIPGGLVDQLYGPGYLPVNSRHHQGFFEGGVAPGLKATAFAPDGITEVIEDPNRPWRFAVQWHPERPEEHRLHERDRRLFRRFVEECRRR